MLKKADQRIQDLHSRIDRELRIDETRISKELSEQSTRYAYWGAAHALKLTEYQMKKKETEAYAAKLSQTTEYDLKQSNGKIRITDKVIKDHVTTDPDYQEKTKELLRLGLEEGILSVAQEAFRQRAQALLEICRLQRSELSTPEAVMQRQLMKEYEVK